MLSGMIKKSFPEWFSHDIQYMYFEHFRRYHICSAQELAKIKIEIA